MDKRGREAKKRYRSSKDVNYVTVSLTLRKSIIDFLKKEIRNTEDKNMSQFIEEIVSTSKVYQMPKRRAFGSFPVKKTCTFTEEFANKIKESENMSLFIEGVLMKKFNLK